MASPTLMLMLPKPSHSLLKSRTPFVFSTVRATDENHQTHIPNPTNNSIIRTKKTMATASLLMGAGLALSLVEPASAAAADVLPFLYEPPNALSLPTWAIHVSSVAEWVIAMALVWQYGNRPGYESWKGLSWGMVPLLGGAFCACTWHFFYNSEDLQVLVAIQAALTVIGNATMAFAAYRIYKSSEGKQEKS